MRPGPPAAGRGAGPAAAHGGGGVTDSVEERSKRLTPREWRVVALVIEGVSTEQACDALGIAPGTFESHKQAVRRKLGVPRGQRLEMFLREHLGSLPIPAEQVQAEPSRAATAGTQAEPYPAERRLRWLLRITLKELSEVAGSAALRAQLLEQTVRRVGSENLEEAANEVGQLQHVADEITATYHRLIEAIRAGTWRE